MATTWPDVTVPLCPTPSQPAPSLTLEEARQRAPPPRGRALRHRRRPARDARRPRLGGHVHHHLPLPRAGRHTFVDCEADVERATLNGARPRPRHGRRRTHPAPAPGPAQRARRHLGAARHRPRRRDPAHRRPVRQARLRLELVRAGRRAPGLGLLRPARPQGAHRFTVSAPAAWTVTSNRAPDSVDDREDGGRVWSFPDTPPLSTYVVVVNAGPFHEIREQRGDHSLGLYCRQSLRRFLERDAERAAAGHRAGPRVLRRAVRVAVPPGALRPGVRARHGRRHGELGLRHLDRRGALPQPAHLRAARVRRDDPPARDGAHVVRRPGDHALVGRPVAQRGVRLLGRHLGARRTPPTTPTPTPPSSPRWSWPATGPT